MVIQNDIAKVLIGNWINKQHIEDIKLFRLNEFDEELSAIVAQLKNGEYDPITIAKNTKTPIVYVADLMSSNYGGIYESAMSNILEDKFREHLELMNGVTVDSVMELATKYSREYSGELPKPVDDMTTRYIAELDARKERETINTGLSKLDEILFGVKKKELTSIAARPSTGKSAFLQMVATNIARKGHKIMFFPLEMTPEQLLERNIMRFTSGIDTKALKSGDLSHEQWDEIQNALDLFHQMEENFIVIENVRDIEVIEQLIKKHKPDVVFIDQLQQMQTSTPTQSVRERFGYMTANLKRIAMEYDCAVWLACQLNRTAREASLPTMEHIKEAGNVEEDSDNIILLGRNKETEEKQGNIGGNRIVSVDVAKQRMGTTQRFDAYFMLKRFTFQPMDNKMAGFYPSAEEIPF